eukprot:Nitzschia sp. Nitz4//scaffold37_size175936//122978//123158//NITZ4_002058-RA/size175936-exonerate_est2genome-gene-0.26-mRNA-1//-1//CDS//3329549824//8036//frame0
MSKLIIIHRTTVHPSQLHVFQTWYRRYYASQALGVETYL